MKKVNILYVLTAFIIMACNNTKTQTVVTQDTTKFTQVKHKTKYKKLVVDGIQIAYREAGDIHKPTIVLLHGFPTSSHQYRKVLNELADEFHLIAPDYPGFGNSDFPSTEEYEYTFNNIAKTINSFLEIKKISKYSIMIQDYGAPIGLRIATAHPERIEKIINQNGNAYEEGLGKGWTDIRKFWANRTAATEKVLYPAFTLEGLKWQYVHGARNPENVNPDTWHLDYLKMSRPNVRNMNLDLLYDYQNNIKLYPKWQQYLREHQPPLLIVWGKNDLFFPESGAQAFKKDVKNIDYNIFDTGHFALEEDGKEIIEKIRIFMNK